MKLCVPQCFYADPNDSFGKAAVTIEKHWQDCYTSIGQQVPSIPRWSFRTKKEFIDNWTDMNNQLRKQGYLIFDFYVFCHSSKENNGSDGIEFAPDSSTPGASTTLTKDELSALVQLPWAGKIGEVTDIYDKKTKYQTQSTLRLIGCNTGLKGARGWCPAEVLAKSQKVHTEGLTGYGYFSTSRAVYSSISKTDKVVYLDAYKRGRNGVLGDGKPMPVGHFYP